MKNGGKNRENPMETKNEDRKDEFINVFSFFEEANAANRAAFSELLNYTYHNKKDQK